MLLANRFWLHLLRLLNANNLEILRFRLSRALEASPLQWQNRNRVQNPQAIDNRD